MGKIALVAGASGVIGRRITEHLAGNGWSVIGLARRPLAGAARQTIQVDLADEGNTGAAIAAARHATHLFYAARYDHPEGVQESEALNTAMLRHLLDGLRGGKLSHVNLVHGTKYYGHPDPIPLPVTEKTPRGARTTFYFAQEDLVHERSAAAGWTWSAARPHIFCDPSPAHPRSMALVIAVYAAIQRELGEPFDFPGSERSFDARTQFTDTRFLAQALEWMATDARCANQAFNVVNGDAPRWRELWVDFARLLGVEAGAVRTMSLARYMADKAPVWDSVVRRHNLAATPLARIALWDYGDYVFRPEWDIMSSMEKARAMGFAARIDTVDMFARAFASCRNERIVP